MKAGVCTGEDGAEFTEAELLSVVYPVAAATPGVYGDGVSFIWACCAAKRAQSFFCMRLSFFSLTVRGVPSALIVGRPLLMGRLLLLFMV